MKQENFLKPGLLRLILILVPLFALVSALTLISRHSPTPVKKDFLCPFMLIVLPPREHTVESLHSLSLNSEASKTGEVHMPDSRRRGSGSVRGTLPQVQEKESTKRPQNSNGTGQTPLRAKKNLPSLLWLQDTRFFQSVLRDFNTGNYPSLELLFYLPLHFTKDNRWLVSTSPSPPQQQGLSMQQIPQKQFFPKTPLTLRDLLDRFPNRKWFLHLMTVPSRDSLKNLKKFSEKSSTLYITSHNEKLLKQLIEEEMTVIYDFKSLLRFQLLGIFLLEKLFSFPGQGLIIPSTLPLSLKTAKKLKHSGQWLFVKKETRITSFPEQKLRQVKGLITREGKQALKWIQDKNPCLQDD